MDSEHNSHGTPSSGLTKVSYPATPQELQPRYIEVAPQRPGGDEDYGTGLIEYWSALFQRRWLICVVTVAGALAGYLYSVPQPDIYRAITSIEVQDKNDSFLNFGDVDPNSRSSYSAESRLLTEMQMLESRSLRSQVYEKLSSPSDVAELVPVTRRSALLETLGLGKLVQQPTRASALSMASGTLEVKNPRDTRIVQVICDSTDPQVAADFANALVEMYDEHAIQGRLQSYKKVGDWLNEQVQEIQEKLKAAEDRLAAYTKESGLFMTAEANTNLASMQRELALSETELLSASLRLEIAEESPPETVSEIVADSTVQARRRKLMELHDQLSELQTALTPEHYKVKRLAAQIEELERDLEVRESNVIERLRTEQRSASRQRELLNNVYRSQAELVADHGDKLIYANMLKREVDAHQQLYQTMSQKVKEASFASALRVSNMFIVDRAMPPSSPYKPNPIRSAAIGGATSLFLIVAFVSLRSSSDRKFRTPNDVASVLQIPHLGAIPAAQQLKRRRRWNGSWGTRSKGRKRYVSLLSPERTDTPGTGQMMAMARGTSLEAESFRGVVTSLLASRPNSEVFVITSAEAGAGKTTVCCNLARSLAEIGRRVIVVDADMRLPVVHQQFGVSNTWGLSDLALRTQVIDDGCPLEALAKETSVDGLWVLPSGPGCPEIPRLLYSPRIDELIDRFRSEFDIVLIDTPPVLSVADARVLAKHSDGAILVVRAGKTTREVGLAAYSRLEDDGVPVIGTILNAWDSKADYAYGYIVDLYK
jgi:capsular exopolysaccharide synthesis family protein